MALKLPGAKNIFPHGRETDTGGGNERIGQATVIVSLDGTGDTDSIQEAIEMLPSTGGVVFIKEGTYDIKSVIQINKSNVKLQGTGKGTVLKCVTTGIGMIETTNNPDAVEVADLLINGNSKVIRGIYFYGCSNSRVFNVKLINAGSTAGANAGIHLDAFGLNMSLYLNNKILFCEAIGFKPDFEISADNSIVTNNTASDSPNHSGIDVYESSNNIIGNNLCDGNWRAGIQIESTATDTITTGNICIGNTTYGILVNGDRTIIENNNCSSNGAYGIDIINTADRTLLTGNITLSNTTAQIRDNGTNTHPNGASGTNNLALDDLNIIA